MMVPKILKGLWRFTLAVIAFVVVSITTLTLGMLVVLLVLTLYHEIAR